MWDGQEDRSTVPPLLSTGTELFVRDTAADPFYWYRLAQAQRQAGRPAEALASIRAAWEAIRRLRSRADGRGVRLFRAPVKTAHGDRWGYVDGAGRMVIPPRFAYADDFQENGLAVVQEHGKSGLIDGAGRYVVPPRYQTITGFSEGRAAVLDERGFQVIDERGRLLTRKPYDYIGMYRDGRAMFSQNVDGNLLYGYLDREGKEAIPPQFQSAGDFSGGKAVVQERDGTYALIGENGQRLHTYPYAFVGPLGDGLLAFSREQGGPMGYIDEAGTVVIPPMFSGALPFEAGRAVVNASTDPASNRYGLIDRHGTFLIQPAYNDIRLLGEGRAAVGEAKDPQQPYTGSVYAIADTDGHFLTGFVYPDVGEFHNGLASADDGRLTFFIDRSGYPAAGFPVVRGTGTLTLMRNVVQANVDQRISYYSRTGRLIWAPNTVIPLSGPYRVKEVKYAPDSNYLVYYPQIEGMHDRFAQARVNRQLKEWSRVPKPVTGKPDSSSYSGDFSVTFFQHRLAVLELSGYEYPFGAAHGMPSRMYAHVDLGTGAVYRLKDLFRRDSHYVQVLSDIVGRQIATDPQYSYVFPDSYKGIRPDQPFYVKEDALYLYFAPYEIAPYAAGFPTFRIPYAEITGIIDQRGPFWRAFH